MSLRFALRPRLRLHESAERPRRRRTRLPPVVVPIAAYWLGMAALTHAVILLGKGEAAENGEVEAAELEPDVTAPSPERVRAESPPEPSATAPASLDAKLPEVAAASEPEPRAALPEVAAASEPEPRAALPEPVPRDRPRIADSEPSRSSARSSEPVPRRAALERERDELEMEREEPAPSEAPAAAPPPRRESVAASSGLPSCESVSESASQDVDFADSRSRAPDLPAEAFSRVLNHGGYLSGCSIPDDTALDICVAVKEGQVRGVTVRASPPNARVSACVGAAVARLRFPHSSRLDVARTRFDALR
jgi:hypothetical protein